MQSDIVDGLLRDSCQKGSSTFVFTVKGVKRQLFRFTTTPYISRKVGKWCVRMSSKAPMLVLGTKRRSSEKTWLAAYVSYLGQKSPVVPWHGILWLAQKGTYYPELQFFDLEYLLTAAKNLGTPAISESKSYHFYFWLVCVRPDARSVRSDARLSCGWAIKLQGENSCIRSSNRSFAYDDRMTCCPGWMPRRGRAPKYGEIRRELPRLFFESRLIKKATKKLKIQKISKKIK